MQIFELERHLICFQELESVGESIAFIFDEMLGNHEGMKQKLLESLPFLGAQKASDIVSILNKSYKLDLSLPDLYADLTNLMITGSLEDLKSTLPKLIENLLAASKTGLSWDFEQQKDWLDEDDFENISSEEASSVFKFAEERIFRVLHDSLLSPETPPEKKTLVSSLLELHFTFLTKNDEQLHLAKKSSLIKTLWHIEGDFTTNETLFLQLVKLTKNSDQISQLFKFVLQWIEEDPKNLENRDFLIQALDCSLRAHLQNQFFLMAIYMIENLLVSNFEFEEIFLTRIEEEFGAESIEFFGASVICQKVPPVSQQHEKRLLSALIHDYNREHLIHIIENAQSELTVFENAVLSKSISNLILQDNYSEAIFIIKRIANLPNLLNGMGVYNRIIEMFLQKYSAELRDDLFSWEAIVPVFDVIWNYAMYCQKTKQKSTDAIRQLQGAR